MSDTATRIDDGMDEWRHMRVMEAANESDMTAIVLRRKIEIAYNPKASNGGQAVLAMANLCWSAGIGPPTKVKVSDPCAPRRIASGMRSESLKIPHAPTTIVLRLLPV